METMFASLTSSGITVSSFLICSLVALLCGALIAFTYTRRTRFTQSLVLAVILLPFAVQTVIMLVNGNVGTGVAVAGAFGLVRFRSAPGNAKDISVIFRALQVIDREKMRGIGNRSGCCMIGNTEQFTNLTDLFSVPMI